MITQKRRIGDIGEELACRFLKENGHTIIERNFPCKFGEIDIIARKGKCLVFAEVKTSSRSIFFAQENINNSKIRKFIKAVEVYFLVRKIKNDKPWQMDAMLVKLDQTGGLPEITRIENINIH